MSQPRALCSAAAWGLRGFARCRLKAVSRHLGTRQQTRGPGIALFPPLQPSPSVPCRSSYSTAVKNPQDEPQHASAGEQEKTRQDELRWKQYRDDYDSEYGGIKTAISSPWLKPSRPWGLVVYRTCYDDEAAWQTWRTCLNDKVRSTLQSAFSGEVLEHLVKRHQPVLMDDRERFGGGDLITLRDYFQEWSRDDLKASLEEEMERSWLEPLHQGTRFNVFAVFDDICVESMHRQHPGPLLMLVHRDWKPMTEKEVRALTQGDVHEDYEDGCMYDHSEGPGGWIYKNVASYTDTYHALRDIHDWSEEFIYPSNVYGVLGLGLERSPAFWREERTSIKEASSHRLE